MELFLSASQNVILKTAVFITLFHHERTQLRLDSASRSLRTRLFRAAFSATTDAVSHVRTVVLPTQIDRGPAVRKPGPVRALERDTAFLLSCYGYGISEADYAARHR